MRIFEHRKGRIMSFFNRCKGVNAPIPSNVDDGQLYAMSPYQYIWAVAARNGYNISEPEDYHAMILAQEKWAEMNRKRVSTDRASFSFSCKAYDAGTAYQFFKACGNSVEVLFGDGVSFQAWVDFMLFDGHEVYRVRVRDKDKDIWDLHIIPDWYPTVWESGDQYDDLGVEDGDYIKVTAAGQKRKKIYIPRYQTWREHKGWDFDGYFHGAVATLLNMEG